LLLRSLKSTSEAVDLRFVSSLFRPQLLPRPVEIEPEASDFSFELLSSRVEVDHLQLDLADSFFGFLLEIVDESLPILELATKLKLQTLATF
jgi:hypothetical protein